MGGRLSNALGHIRPGICGHRRIDCRPQRVGLYYGSRCLPYTTELLTQQNARSEEAPGTCSFQAPSASPSRCTMRTEMTDQAEQAMLEELKNFDTPSITNVVATYPNSPLCLGLYNPWTENWYTDQSVRCMYPELGRLVAYAVTCVYGLPDPNFARLSFMDVIDALDASPKPTILVLQQKFPPEIAGKVGLAGGNMVSAMKAIGCVGMISNGPSRDLDEIRPMRFQYMLSGVTAGHGAMAVQSVNAPVSVAGMDVAPGEIIHMD